MVIQGTYVGVDSTLQGGSNTGVVGVTDDSFEEAASLNPQEGGGKRKNKKLSTKRRKKTKKRRRRTKGRRNKYCKCKVCRCKPCKCNKTNPKKTKLSRERQDISSFRRHLYETIHRGRLKKYGDITI